MISFKRLHKAAFAFLAASAVSNVAAQELNCTVEVNSSAIEGSNKSVFETLQQSITEYMNDNKWTNAVFSPNEKIECRMFFLTHLTYLPDLPSGVLLPLGMGNLILRFVSRLDAFSAYQFQT